MRKGDFSMSGLILRSVVIERGFGVLVNEIIVPLEWNCKLSVGIEELCISSPTLIDGMGASRIMIS
jgi:hypothetical protein